MAVNESDLETSPEAAALATDARVHDLIHQVETKLREYTAQYQAKYERLSAQAAAKVAGKPAEDAGAPEIAEPITPFPVPYLWFDLLAAGPFQPLAPGGPFAPNRVIRTGEQAFLLAVLWRNPVPLLGGPSAAQVMSAFTFRLRGHTVNLNTVTAGPDLAPVTAGFGGGFINVAVMPIPAVPVPVQGDPTLLEIHMTVDVLGPGPGLPPFAGFATRWFQPDLQPGFLGLPDILPGFVEEHPVRVLIYS